MRLKPATYTVEYADGSTEDLDTVDEVQEVVEPLDAEYEDAVDYTLVYQCQEDNHEYADDPHEYPTDADTWDEVDNYAIEDADPCERCRGDYALINTVVLDRIVVNNDDAAVTAIHINY